MESQLFAQTDEGNVKDETIQNRRADKSSGSWGRGHRAFTASSDIGTLLEAHRIGCSPWACGWLKRYIRVLGVGARKPGTHSPPWGRH